MRYQGNCGGGRGHEEREPGMGIAKAIEALETRLVRVLDAFDVIKLTLKGLENRLRGS